MTILKLYQSVVARLKDALIEYPEAEADLLVGHVFEKNRAGIFLAKNEEASSQKIDQIESLLQRRLKREPLAYVLGEKEFWSLSFKVTPDVLVPRPETEQFLEVVLDTISSDKKNITGSVLDLGVGSGVISVILARELPDAKIIGIDRSINALQVARENVMMHDVQSRVHFLCGDWLSPLKSERRFRVVVSNPPYVSSADLSDLQPELAFEPRWALDGGRQGLDEIKRIIPEVNKILLPGGWFFMEIGSDQAGLLQETFSKLKDFDSVVIHKDYAGLSRILQARLKS